MKENDEANLGSKFRESIKKRLQNISSEELLYDELASAKYIVKFQFLAIGVLFLTYIAYLIFGKYVPTFDFSSLWNKTDNVFGSVIKYWYVFAWGIGLSIVLPLANGRFSKIIQIFSYDVVTSTLAGIWEEIGYRGLYIFTAMIGIILANFFFKYLIIVIIAVLIIWLIVKMTKANLFRIIVLIGGIALIVWILKVDFIGNPVYWIYEKIMFPIWHFVSFGLLDSILYNKNFSFLFIIGAMSANLKFSDGHKYQGLFGSINSWIIGFIFLHAMMTYGLSVAILIHAIYDISIGLTRFTKRMVTKY